MEIPGAAPAVRPRGRPVGRTSNRSFPGWFPTSNCSGPTTGSARRRTGRGPRTRYRPWDDQMAPDQEQVVGIHVVGGGELGDGQAIGPGDRPQAVPRLDDIDPGRAAGEPGRAGADQQAQAEHRRRHRRTLDEPTPRSGRAALVVRSGPSPGPLGGGPGAQARQRTDVKAHDSRRSNPSARGLNVQYQQEPHQPPFQHYSRIYSEPEVEIEG